MADIGTIQKEPDIHFPSDYSRGPHPWDDSFCTAKLGRSGIWALRRRNPWPTGSLVARYSLQPRGCVACTAGTTEPPCPLSGRRARSLHAASTRSWLATKLNSSVNFQKDLAFPESFSRNVLRLKTTWPPPITRCLLPNVLCPTDLYSMGWSIQPELFAPIPSSDV